MKTSRVLPAVTAAALPFVIQDDTWYPSVEAARDFGLALQNGLQQIEGVSWVERAEIEKAEAELVHGAAGLLSPGQSMGIGQWVKADLLVTGVLKWMKGSGASSLSRWWRRTGVTSWQSADCGWPRQPGCL